MKTITEKLKTLGIEEKAIPNLVKTLLKAKINFEKRGFNCSENTVIDFFISQYKKGTKNPRKDAMNALFKAKFPPIKKTAKVGRNIPCPCGSDKKYKKCCLKK